MTPPLDGIAVLVTRPAQQAEAWRSALTDAGARVFLQPGLEIHAAAADEASLQHLQVLAPDCCAVFTSVPAVDAALALQPALQELDCWAVGRQTARRLIQAGCRRVLAPESAAGVDALLADERFPGHQRVLIACARGGRKRLARRLSGSGYEVASAYVYRRRPAALQPGLVAQLAGLDQPLVTVATSRAILERVHELLAPHIDITGKPLVVVSERIARRAGELGYDHVVIAGQPGLDSVVTAIGVAVGRVPDTGG